MILTLISYVGCYLSLQCQAPRPSSAMLCPAQVLQQTVHAVSQEEDSTLLLSHKVTQGLVSVHPLQPFIQS